MLAVNKSTYEFYQERSALQNVANWATCFLFILVISSNTYTLFLSYANMRRI